MPQVNQVKLVFLVLLEGVLFNQRGPFLLLASRFAWLRGELSSFAMMTGEISHIFGLGCTKGRGPVLCFNESS